MLSRLPCALHNISLSRVPSTTTTNLLYPRSSISAPSPVPWRHSGRRGASTVSPDLCPKNNKQEKVQHAAATEAVDKDYSSPAECYFEAVIEYTGHAQEGGSKITIERHNDIITISAPGVGDYILRRQDSTKQLWLHSPKSGSKYYDWVGDYTYMEGFDGWLEGRWVHLADGVTLSEVLNTELGLEMEGLFS